jgi:hypothetical protein
MFSVAPICERVFDRSVGYDLRIAGCWQQRLQSLSYGREATKLALTASSPGFRACLFCAYAQYCSRGPP